MMLRLLSKREKIILYITAGTIAFSIVFVFVIAPLSKEIEVLNREINFCQMKLAKYKKLLSRKDYILAQYNKFSSVVSLSELGKDYQLTVFSAIETFAKDSNIRLIDIRPKGEKGVNKDGLIDLKAEGMMENYLEFIYKVENSLLLLKIKKFQLNAKPDTQSLEGVFSIFQLSVRGVTS